MYSMKKLLFLSFVPLLFSLLSFTNAVASGEGALVTIKIYETCKVCGGKPVIQVIEEGNTRFIELEWYNAQAPEKSKNAETIHNLLEQYYKAGYKIVSSIGNGTITTHILTK